LGADKEIVIKRFLTQKLLRMESAKGLEVEVNAVFLDIDDQTGLAQNIARIRKIVALD
jgi:calcineurin-like phosphoesterase